MVKLKDIRNLNNFFDKKEEGFTLIELLVVILIIGILTAIAVPVFLNQRKAAADAALNSDMKNTVTAIQTYIAEKKTSGLPVTATIIRPYLSGNGGSGVSRGTTIAVSGNSEEFCVLGENHNGNLKTWATTNTFLYYNSKKGGWQDNSIMWNDNCTAPTGIGWTFIN